MLSARSWICMDLYIAAMRSRLEKALWVSGTNDVDSASAEVVVTREAAFHAFPCAIRVAKVFLFRR